MSRDRDSLANTLKVAIALCVVCSVLVSGFAVGLRGMQDRNRKLDRQKNILIAAGLLETAAPTAAQIQEAYEQIEPRLVDLETGEYVELSEIEALNIDSLDEYDQQKAARDPELSVAIPRNQDIAGIKRREKYSLVYLVRDEEGDLEQIVLPVYGKGLWSTLYGFLALDSDTRTVRGLTFYEHGETPGLGGEVDNEDWKAQWRGLEAFGDDWDIRVQVVKGTVNPDSPASIHQVDGLAGATITARGVEYLMHYWLGEHGFGPFLEKLRAEGGEDG